MRKPTRIQPPILQTALAALLGLTVSFPRAGVARDILRGGGTGAGSNSSGAATQSAASSQSAAISTRTRDTLSRTTQALKAVRKMQSDARALAQAAVSSVPNGLTSGGLQVASGGTWTGAGQPTQTTASGKTSVVIQQNKAQALLSWTTFNVGKETTLTFDQSAGGSDAGTWIAFNSVTDPSGVPSKILGSVKADGQVYIINSNGIIFGGASQINVHTLVASALPINWNLLDSGLLNNPDAQFLFSSLAQDAGSNGTPAFSPGTIYTSDGRPGNVTVEAGAQITCPSDDAHTGGRVVLAGANVTNNGTISTPDGQTILAAGLQVGFAAHSSDDASLRGLDVYVGAVDSDSGTATNAGEIDAERGNVTITGKTVKQLGSVYSTTSVSLNGRVDLLASYGAVSNISYDPVNYPDIPPYLFKSTGTVILGAGSVIEILPETWDSTAIVASQWTDASRSQVNIEGLAVHFESNATILAPNAKVNISAGIWNYQSMSGRAQSDFIHSAGQIYLDAGAAIDVAGSEDVEDSIENSIISVQLLGAELADSPVQRSGVLRGKTVKVDIRQSGTYNGTAWTGTPLAEVSGYAGLIERNVAQLTTAGGSVTLSAGASVVLQAGSKIDASGGWLNVKGGTVTTTRLISGGHLYAMAEATPDLVYDGVYSGFTTTHSRWNISKTYTSRILLGTRTEQGYLQGGDAGSISVTAPGMALDGDLYGNTVTGQRQRTDTPAAGALTLTFEKIDKTSLLAVSPTPPDIVIASGTSLVAADAFSVDEEGNPAALRSERTAEVILSPGLVNQNGFGTLTISNGDGKITVPEGTALSVAAGGAVTLSAANLDVEGAISVPGGSISLTVYDYSPYELLALGQSSSGQAPVADSTRGLFTLGSSAFLDTSGLIVDDRNGVAGAESLPLVTGGGDITIKSYSAELKAGSRIDVSGGVAITGNGKRSYGDAGTLTIQTGLDPGFSSMTGGSLVMEATLSGYAGLGAEAGSLAIQAEAVRVGGVSSSAGTLLLAPDFFNSGGFGSFTLTGIGSDDTAAVLIAEGTVIAPKVKSWLAVTDASSVEKEIVLLPEGVRDPVNLTFNAPGVIDYFTHLVTVRGDIEMEEGASIVTDAGGNVTLNGNTVSVLGSITAPGGSISIKGSGDSTFYFGDQDHALATVEIGPRSILSTAGKTVVIPDDARGYRIGQVYDGGSITVSGNIVAEEGAVLDVSGTSGVLDLPVTSVKLSAKSAGSLRGFVRVPYTVESDGGSITLTGKQMLFTGAALRGAAGGENASGGSLAVSSGRFIALDSGVSQTPLDVTLEVTQQGGIFAAKSEVIGKTVMDADGNGLEGIGHFAADDFLAGGFGSLTLGGVVRFSGAVAIAAPERLTVATGGILYGDAAIRLSAPYVAVGMAFQTPQDSSQIQSPFQYQGTAYAVSPTHGTGELSITASLIDIGNLSLQSIGNAVFDASNGDIRGDGVLDVAGAITMTAGQIYPPTETSFTIAAYDYVSGGVIQQGSVTIRAAGTRSLPFSAGGELNIYGSVITQGGVLRAPFGTIQIGWDGTGDAPQDLLTGGSVATTSQLMLAAGSITSVSAVDSATGEALTIPYGVNLNGSSWIDPAGNDISTSGAPAKSVLISAASIDDEAGSSIDLRGGGDLYAYRYIQGNGGSEDVLDTLTSFAVIPGYSAEYAPYASYNTSPLVPSNLGSDAGYVSSGLKVGDRVYLSGGGGLAAGYYTLLPARYALITGAYLVKPVSGTPTGATVSLTDGAALVSGYRSNSHASSQAVYQRFEVASSSVVRARSEYEDTSANAFFADVSRVPADSGQLVFQATRSMKLNGTVLSAAIGGGRGGLIDISSPLDILITSQAAAEAQNQLVLDAASLTAFGAESLLIGGIRSIGDDGTTVTVSTGSVTVDNAGAPLSAADLVLVAKTSLTLATGAEIASSGSVTGGAEKLFLGDSETAGSGDGVLLRVSGDASAEVSRKGISLTGNASVMIGAGASLSGGSIILDSSQSMTLDSEAGLSASAVSLRSGQISILLNGSGGLEPGSGLILSGDALESLQQNLTALTLVSYSSLDLYGAGRIGGVDSSGQPVMEKLTLEAGAIRGFNNAGGTVTFSARNLTLGNSAEAAAEAAASGAAGTLCFNAQVIQLDSNRLAIDRFAQVLLNASGGIVAQGTGTLDVQNALTIMTPLITGATGADMAITAGGALSVASAGSTASVAGGLGAALTLEAASISVSSQIVLPSGNLTLHATGGNLSVAGRLDTAGSESELFDVISYTDAGTISLTADAGDVNIMSGAVLTVAAQSGGGNAGTLSISAPAGNVSVAGSLTGSGGAGGNFTLDVSALSSTASFDALLNAGGFAASRSYRIRTGDVTVGGYALAHGYELSADQGSITVAGTVDASGDTSGEIHLYAMGGVSVISGAVLTVAVTDFDNAGKGGEISLETRGKDGARIDIQAGSLIDLSVDGGAGGMLHLRAPRTAAGTDVLVDTILGTVCNASALTVEGYKVYTPSGGSIDSVKASVLSDGVAFLGSAGSSSAGYSAMWNRLLGNDSQGLSPVLRIAVGAEIVNPSGDLTLASTWNLSTYRFGPDSTAGVLTLRAAGNLTFNFKASLNDGFDGTGSALWQALLLPEGSASWSYRLVAGAEFNADQSSTADYRKLKALSSLGADSGSVLVGKGSTALPTATNNSRQTILPNYYQTIRTGSGDIDIYAGRDVRLLNPIATIYTAGVQADAMSDFDIPSLNYRSTQLGSTQSPIYPAQYSTGGGNVTIFAQNNIGHYISTGSGVSLKLVADSTREMPTNWLYRRGYVDPLTGRFAATYSGGEIESTSWWIDFSNFYEGIGALGGGNVTLIAGNDISNIDAVVPTNARMPKGTPSADKLEEYGGGDLLVRAGHDIDGGVYYVERGMGVLVAGNSIHTNSTRAALKQYDVTFLEASGLVPDETTWLPTTLFLGKGSFEVTALGDILLGPAVNPFLLPQGINNSFYEKSYFSTYAETTGVKAVSLTGDVTLKSNPDGDAGSLFNWYKNVLLYYGNSGSYSYSQPWLRLAETSITPFETAMSLLPGTLRVTAFSGDIGIVGDLTLAPSPTGTLELLAAGSINGLQINSVDSESGASEWSTSTINVSDADPNRIPGVTSPLTLSGSATGFQGGAWNYTQANLFDAFNSLFSDSGSTEGAQGVLQTKQALHSPGLLHSGDTSPVRLYANSGDISGMILFSPKVTQIFAGQDISDIAFYLQNLSADDVTIVSAGRDLLPYNANSPLRQTAQTSGNLLELDGTPVLPLAGDIQIGGPGTLEVLAGRKLDLGVGSESSDGTGLGITSVGNERNPALSTTGADIIVAAGIGVSSGLSGSLLDFDSFISQFLDPATAGTYAERYLPELGTLLGISGNEAIWDAFLERSKEQQYRYALTIFYDVLRDAGRDYQNSASAGYQNYDAGFAAIAALFPGNNWNGDILLASREIKTDAGGNISIFAPGGKLTVGYDLSGHQPVDQGILTAAGGNISICTDGDVIVGTSRIFTLRGGNEIIWSTTGDIAAGASSKTVQSAPPTRVVIDTQSAAVKTDLAGLATGGGIGVLETVEGVAPGDVDLIAPSGVVDAGDAGVRVSGNLTIAATAVLNSGNIQVTGVSTGIPVVTVPIVNTAGLTAALNTVGAVTASAEITSPVASTALNQRVELPSIITVEVLGYGGGEDEDAVSN